MTRRDHELDLAAAVSGRVVDETGAPRAGVMVFAAVADTHAEIERRFAADSPLGDGRHAETDANGRFHLRGLPARRGRATTVRLTAERIGPGVDVEVRPDVPIVAPDIVLSREVGPREVTFRVVRSDGSSVAGARAWTPGRELEVVRSSSDGRCVVVVRFDANGVPPVRVAADGCATARVSVPREPNGQIDVVLSPEVHLASRPATVETRPRFRERETRVADRRDTVTGRSSGNGRSTSVNKDRRISQVPPSPARATQTNRRADKDRRVEQVPPSRSRTTQTSRQPNKDSRVVQVPPSKERASNSRRQNQDASTSRRTQRAETTVRTPERRTTERRSAERRTPEARAIPQTTRAAPQTRRAPVAQAPQQRAPQQRSQTQQRAQPQQRSQPAARSAPARESSSRSSSRRSSESKPRERRR